MLMHTITNVLCRGEMQNPANNGILVKMLYSYMYMTL